MTTITEIRTVTGSRYFVRVSEDGSWWFRAENKPNKTSVALEVETWYEIEPVQPWPPRVGKGLVLWSIYPISMVGDIRRPPGGGKITSPVVEVLDISIVPD